ncbi:uncharacterized protein LOC125940380 [Dermacentor silvarum]|uniref:uncharacterized protein LOC125940380 n=1 Tax=Dermacentor silvarum TaxID=543639 RepID=UPI002100E1E1|nr:uncharacterized protein LOC125940380 [Dermacentor silvarum]
MPSKKERTCFVPLCRGGYKSSTEKVSLFRAPSDPVRLKEWARSIKRDDNVLSETCVVCSRHFNERFVQRTFKHVINGQIVELDRERPTLTEDAIPTIFPDAPSYFTKQLPKNRAERNLDKSDTRPAKRRAPNNDPAEAIETLACTDETPQRQCPLGEIELPSAVCSKILLPCGATALCFAWHTVTEPGDVRVVKHVTFSTSTEAATTPENSHVCRVFCRGIKTEEFCVNNECDAAQALKKVDEMLLCPGCGIEPVTGSQCMQFGPAHFSKNCRVVSPDGKPCLHCKYTRKLVKNQMCRLKKKEAKTIFKRRMARKSLELFRTKKRLAQA